MKQVSSITLLGVKQCKSPMKHSIGCLVAAISLYTRIPAWRLMPLTKTHYQEAVHLLAFVGLLTGGVMASTFYLAMEILGLPLLSAIVLAFAARILLTGAFHEDGLGDFFDGFGGGHSKEDILRIMKDSQIGNYAVIGYLLYYLSCSSILMALPEKLIPAILLLCDCGGKLSVGILTARLPYARPEHESKTGIIYTSRHMPHPPQSLLYAGLAIAGAKLLGSNVAAGWLIPSIVFALGFRNYVKRKIGGYTGDTCGALSLLSELVSYVTLYLLIQYC